MITDMSFTSFSLKLWHLINLVRCSGAFEPELCHITYLLISVECHSSAWMLLSETIFLCSSLCLCHRCSHCKHPTLRNPPTGRAVPETGMCTSRKPLVSIHNLSASHWIIMLAKSFGKMRCISTAPRGNHPVGRPTASGL